MNTQSKKRKKDYTEVEIDKLVEEQANNNSSWEAPIHVRKMKQTSISLPADIAARAAFLARMHKEKDYEMWIKRIIKERIELEEVAFGEAKRDMASKGMI